MDLKRPMLLFSVCSYLGSKDHNFLLNITNKDPFTDFEQNHSHIRSFNEVLETDSKKIILDQKYSPNKKSRVLVRSS